MDSGDDLSQWVHDQQQHSHRSPQPPTLPADGPQRSLSLTTQALLNTLDAATAAQSQHTYAPPPYAQHGHQQPSTVAISVPPPTSAAMMFASLTAPGGFVDSNSYEDSFPVDDSYGTPSYAGSWTSSASLSSSRQPPHPAGGFEYLYQQAQQKQQEAGSLRNGLDPFMSYRESSSWAGGLNSHSSLLDDDGSSAYGGSSRGAASGASSNAGGSVIGADDDLDAMVDFDFDPVMITDGSRSASPANFSTVNSPAPASPSLPTFALPSASAYADSPPAQTRSNTIVTNRTTSPPLLAPLAIPSDGPSFNLIQPTPHTARPRDGHGQKGQGTLELERILGMTDWGAKSAQSFSDFPAPAQPHRPSSSASHHSTASSSHRPVFTDTSAFTSAPESLEQPSARGPLDRQRSKSEADLRDAVLQAQAQQAAAIQSASQPQLPPEYTAAALGSNFASQEFEAGAPPPHPLYNAESGFSVATQQQGQPPPFHLDPAIAWHLIQQSQAQALQYQQMAAGDSQQLHSTQSQQDLAALAYQQQLQQQQWLAQAQHAQNQQSQQQAQHELALRSRSALGFYSSSTARRAGAGGPGYYEAGLLGDDAVNVGEDDGTGASGYDARESGTDVIPGVTHRRSRSQGAAADSPYGARTLPSSMWPGGTSAMGASGFLAPPDRRSKSRSRSRSPSGSFADHADVASPAGSSMPSNSAVNSPAAFMSPPRNMSASPEPPVEDADAFPTFPTAEDDDDDAHSSFNGFMPPRDVSGGSLFPAAVGPATYLPHQLSQDPGPPPPHRSFSYHSPSPSRTASYAGSSVGEGDYGFAAATPASSAGSATKVSKRHQVTRESKTTQATKEAAMKRRNPGTQAKFICDLCGESFTRRYNLRGHQRAHRNEKPFACSYEGCTKAFARAHDCKRHELLHLNVRRYQCEPCQRDFVRLDALQRHHRSDVGQACVDQLRAQGYTIPYDTDAAIEA